MRLPVDDRFVEEAARYQLAYTCEECVYFLKEERACIHEWPVEDHLARREPGSGPGEVVFCKELEIR